MIKVLHREPLLRNLSWWLPFPQISSFSCSRQLSFLLTATSDHLVSLRHSRINGTFFIHNYIKCQELWRTYSTASQRKRSFCESLMFKEPVMMHQSGIIHIVIFVDAEVLHFTAMFTKHLEILRLSYEQWFTTCYNAFMRHYTHLYNYLCDLSSSL